MAAIGFLGRLVKEKGLDVFAEVARNGRADARGVKHPYLLVVGEGPRARLVRRTDDPGRGVRRLPVGATIWAARLPPWNVLQPLGDRGLSATSRSRRWRRRRPGGRRRALTGAVDLVERRRDRPASSAPARSSPLCRRARRSLPGRRDSPHAVGEAGHAASAALWLEPDEPHADRHSICASSVSARGASGRRCAPRPDRL